MTVNLNSRTEKPPVTGRSWQRIGPESPGPGIGP